MGPIHLLLLTRLFSRKDIQDAFDSLSSKDRYRFSCEWFALSAPQGVPGCELHNKKLIDDVISCDVYFIVVTRYADAKVLQGTFFMQVPSKPDAEEKTCHGKGVTHLA